MRLIAFLILHSCLMSLARCALSVNFLDSLVIALFLVSLPILTVILSGFVVTPRVSIISLIP